MKHTKLFVLLALVFALALYTHSGIMAQGSMPKPQGSAHKSEGSMPKMTQPAAEGEAFWTYITETNPYTKWGNWPGYDKMYPGKSPHGKYLKLYANDLAIKAAKEGSPMPNGAIVIKENYGEDQKTLMAVTPMYKVKGYNPEGGDWFWGKYGADGTIMKAGKVEGCINCHRAMEDKDWLFTEPK
jgi:hypothetical protein